MTKLFLKILILFAVFYTCFASLSFAQGANDITNAIERLNRTIEQVRELVESLRNKDAQQLVVQAERLRDEAVTAISNRKPIEARAKMDLAFSLLKKATEIALSAPVKRLQNQLEELIQRADQLVLGSCDKEAERVLQEAKSHRDQAVRSATSGHAQVAAEHYRLAVELALKSIDLVSRTRDRIDQEKRKFENMAERAREIIDGCTVDNARQIFQRAKNLAFEAEQALQDCNHVLAKRLYNHSLLLLMRALDLCSKSQAVDGISRAEIKLYQLRNRIEDFKGIILRGGNPNAGRMLERVVRFADDAERAIAQNRERQALRRIQLAENMLNRARRLSTTGRADAASERLANEIENTKSEISELSAKVASSSPADVKIFLRMAGMAIDRAERASAAGFNRLALEAVLSAQKFLTRAEHLLSSGQSDNLTYEKIELRLNQLDAAIFEAEEKVSQQNQEWLLQMLESAKDIRQLSLEALQQGNYNAANGGIQVAFELVRKVINN